MDRCSESELVEELTDMALEGSLSNAIYLAVCQLSELVLAEIVAKCANINSMALVDGMQLSQLMAACLHGNPDYVQDLLEVPGIEIDLQNDKGWHALACACVKEHVEVVRLILDACPDPQRLVNLQDTSGAFPLSEAIVIYFTEIVSLFPRAGNVDYLSLPSVMMDRKRQLLTLLISKGADVNMQENKGFSALMLASRGAYAFQSLPHLPDEDKLFSSLITTAQCGYLEAVQVLLENGADVNMQASNGTTSLMMASLNCQTEFVSMLLQNGANVNIQNSIGATALTMANYCNYKEIALLLLESGSNVNLTLFVENRVTTLMLATINGHAEIVSLLLQYGADVDLALLVACDSGHTRIVELLLTYQANVNQQHNDNGVSGLMLAIYWGHAEICQLLLRHNAIVDLRDEDGRTALMYAVVKNRTDLVPCLLERGAQVDMQGASGISPLIYACFLGQTNLAKILLDHRANINLQDNYGRSPLIYAVRMNHIDLVHHLLEKGAQIDLQESTGFSPLMVSCCSGHTELTCILLVRGANVNLQNEEGITALMISSKKGNTEIVELLLKYKADVNINSVNGSNAIQLSRENNHDAVTKLLIDYGAGPEMKLGKRNLSTRDSITFNRDAFTYSAAIISLEERVKNVEITMQNVWQSMQIILKSIQSLVESNRTLQSTNPELQLETKPTLQEAFRVLRPLAYDWQNIGVLLGLESHCLKEIKYNNTGSATDCLREMLDQWLKHIEPPPSWRQLAEAVKDAGDAEHQDIACKIRKL